ncbi:MAG: hypothetical protein ACLFWL_08700 [Candidatus Brocadiia bacterium]
MSEPEAEDQSIDPWPQCPDCKVELVREEADWLLRVGGVAFLLVGVGLLWIVPPGQLDTAWGGAIAAGMLGIILLRPRPKWRCPHCGRGFPRRKRPRTDRMNQKDGS